MLAARRFQTRAAAALAAASLLSCAGDDGANVSFAGIWEGVVAGSPAYVSLTQQGPDVAGTLDGMALVGRVDGLSLSFSLTGAGLYCSVAATGSATITGLPDRDRLQLRYLGADSCNGTFSRSGWLDRLRCAGGMLACSGGQAEGWVPYCAQGQADASNCGYCGLKCGEYQACSAGQCQVPACTGPVRLEALRQYRAAQRLVSLALADLNGDGALDAVVPSQDTWYLAPIAAAVSVLLGDGRGGFGSPVSTALTLAPMGIAIGDLDRDGRLDVVVYQVDYDTLADSIQVLLGNGDGSFRLGQTFPAGVDDQISLMSHRPVALADLDGDGALDLVFRSGPAVQVRLGLGDGSFGPGQEHALPAAPGAVLASDLDGDGIVDLAVASYRYPDRRVSVLLGNGDGTFQRPVDFEGVESPQDIGIGDFDGNGVPDLVVAGETYYWGIVPYPAVAVLLGNGDGTFGPPLGIVQRQYETGLALAVADLDGDGHQDVAVAVGGEFDVVLGIGDGTFATGVLYPVPSWDPAPMAGAKSIAAADLDGDGSVDLMVANWEQTVSVFLACRP